MPTRLLLALLAVPLTLVACETPTEVGDLDDLDEQVAYIVGHDLGQTLAGQLETPGVDLDRDLILAAVREGLNGDSMRFSRDEAATIMRAFQDTLMVQMARTNTAAGEAFLAEVAERDSVEATQSGLLYKVLEEGEGASPELGETVVVNYRGTLPDGTEFDSSFRGGQPAQFVVGEVIEGWNEALQLMKPGGRWMLYIPSDLAYGEQARSQQIGPNQTLVFEVELLDVNPDQE